MTRQHDPNLESYVNVRDAVRLGDQASHHARINIFDQDTLVSLRKQGADEYTIKRVEAAMKESTAMFERARELEAERDSLKEELEDAWRQADDPSVVWVVPLSYARELHAFLYANMPGGYQAYHDELLESIQRATKD